MNFSSGFLFFLYNASVQWACINQIRELSDPSKIRGSKPRRVSGRVKNLREPEIPQDFRATRGRKDMFPP
jgi:hypothetical protein